MHVGKELGNSSQHLLTLGPRLPPTEMLADLPGSVLVVHWLLALQHITGPTPSVSLIQSRRLHGFWVLIINRMAVTPTTSTWQKVGNSQD